MKGIILAGGSGTRLYPVTQVVSKQLLPVYDKPMIYYPLSTLMLAGIRDILRHLDAAGHAALRAAARRRRALGHRALRTPCSRAPDGLAQAFIIGRDVHRRATAWRWCWATTSSTATTCRRCCSGAAQRQRGATVFAYPVNDPERYGVVEFDAKGRAVSLEEKPKQPKSRYAVTGLYFYDNQVVDIAAVAEALARAASSRSPTSTARYLERGELDVVPLGRGYAWLDTGTHESLLEAAPVHRDASRSARA